MTLPAVARLSSGKRMVTIKGDSRDSLICLAPTRQQDPPCSRVLTPKSTFVCTWPLDRQLNTLTKLLKTTLEWQRGLTLPRSTSFNSLMNATGLNEEATPTSVTCLISTTTMRLRTRLNRLGEVHPSMGSLSALCLWCCRTTHRIIPSLYYGLRYRCRRSSLALNDIPGGRHRKWRRILFV